MKSRAGWSCWQFMSAIVFVVSLAPCAFTAEWAEKLFKEKQHDFGTVGRNAKTEHAFVIENCFEEDVHIAGVRSSCGCTTPVVPKTTLKAWEKGEVIAQFNTKSFIGDKSASITVVIDRPYYAEVTLLVKGKIRSDIVLSPGEVNYGDVDVGETKAIDLSISYAGRRDWAITDVRGDVDCIEVKLDPAVRQQNILKYRMHIRLRDNAKVGELQEEITVVTNDVNEPFFRIPVYARINPPVSVVPKFVSVGKVKEGQSVQSKLMVRAKKPFSIQEINCEDARFSFEVPKGEKPMHIIPITFKGELAADEVEQSIKQAIRIKTSLSEEHPLETTFAGKVVH
jgi:hypothetical protein